VKETETTILADTEGEELAREREALLNADQAVFGNKNTFDMFSDSPADGTGVLPGTRQGLGNDFNHPGRRAGREALLADHSDNHEHLQSNWDDGEGYYKAAIGEILSARYRTMGIVGKGVFSTVLKCIDLTKGPTSGTMGAGKGPISGTNDAALTEEIVAIKLIRNNDTMRKAAEKEMRLLLLLTEKDPHNKRHCIRLKDHFEYRHHIAMVFEFQSMNLRETLKKFGKDVGINISAIRIYGRQLFFALKFLSELKIVHADIKLDNILISEDLKTVKLCDFGSAFLETDTDNDPTPYLVSRFYRAPEIILGLPCKCAFVLNVCLICYV
jgi:serine/threonine-protein kinase PRP4